MHRHRSLVIFEKSAEKRGEAGEEAECLAGQGPKVLSRLAAGRRHMPEGHGVPQPPLAAEIATAGPTGLPAS